MTNNKNMLDIPEFLRRTPTIKRAIEAYEKIDILNKEKEQQTNESKSNTRNFAA